MTASRQRTAFGASHKARDGSFLGGATLSRIRKFSLDLRSYAAAKGVEGDLETDDDIEFRLLSQRRRAGPRRGVLVLESDGLRLSSLTDRVPQGEDPALAESCDRLRKLVAIPRPRSNLANPKTSTDVSIRAQNW